MGIKYRAILDTETAGGLSHPLPYDFSYQIVKGKSMEVVERRAFVIREIFDNVELMDTAYYKNKMPIYFERIRKGEAKKVSQYTARRIFLEDCKKYHVKELYAYNMMFDYRACNNLIRYVTKGKYRWFFPKRFKLCCIWAMSADAFLSSRKYFEMAEEKGWFSEKKNVLSNAECAYRFCTGQETFEEKHIGIDDVEIETEILKFCLKSHKKLNKKPSGGIWFKAQKFNPNRKKKKK